MKITNEKDMYPLVRNFFEQDLRCKYVRETSDEQAIKIEGRGKPDIVGLSIKEGEYLIHMAEGKLLRNRQNFSECMGQAESCQGYADYLWVFFPKDEYNRLYEETRNEYKQKLEEKGIGLLLVSDEVERIQKSEQNRKISQEKRKQVLLQFDTIEQVISFEKPLKEHLTNTSEIFCCFYDIMKNIVGGVMNKKRKVSEHIEARRNWYVLKYYGDGVGIEADPFGLYLRNGEPMLWVWGNISDNRLKNYLDKKEFLFGTHILFEDKDYSPKGQIKSIYEVEKETVDIFVTQKGLKNIWIGHAIDVNGRTREGLKKQLQYLLRLAKKL